MKDNTVHMPRWKIWTIILVGVLAVIVTTAVDIYLINRNITTRHSDVVVMQVTGRGGMCPEGECTYATDNLYEDGIFENHLRVSAEEVAKLREIVSKKSFETMRVENGMCSSYVDGTDTVLLFPSIYGEKRFIPCMMSAEDKNGTFLNGDLAYVMSLIRKLE